MNERHLRYGLLCIILVSLSSSLILAQTPLTVGPVTVTVPRGWNTQTNAIPVRLFSPDSTPQQFVSVELFPPQEMQQDLATHHAMIWGRMMSLFQSPASPQSGTTGQFIWTKAEAQRAMGPKETIILYSTKSGSSYVGIAVEAASPLLSRNLPAIQEMVRRAVLSDASAPQAPGNANVAGPQANTAAPPARAGGAASLQDYVYATPPGWTANQYSDGIVLTSPVSQTGERCMISMWPMRPTSGNLQTDAVTAFQQIYSTYQPRNRTSDGAPIEASLVRGTSGNGWDYVIVKQGIGKPGGQWESLLGFVMAAQLNNRVAVISGLSKEPLRSACMGELTGANTWPRFFYNLGFRNWTPQDQAAAMRNKIAGTWTMATGTASAQITLAANGRYADAAAAQQYNRINNAEVLRTTQAYFGNGAYTLKGNTISFIPDNKGKSPDSGFYRLEEESKDGGRTWVESLYIFRTSTVDGQEYEVRYKK